MSDALFILLTLRIKGHILRDIMAAPAEREPFRYDPERALFLYRQIDQALTAKESAGLAYVGRAPISAPYRRDLNEPGFIVAPWEAEFDIVALDGFTRSLTPGISPEYQYGPSPWPDGGMYFGHLNYASVPGYVMYKGEVTHPSSGTADWRQYEALRDLEAQTGRKAREFVKEVSVTVYPDARLADFILEYERALVAGNAPYSPLLNDIASGLESSRLAYLRERPDDFYAWLREQIEVARNYKGIWGNLSLSQPNGWRPKP